MKPLSTRFLVITTAVAVLGLFIACADSDSAADPPLDGSTGLPPGPDATVDAVSPKDVDEVPRVCSDDGFCHTILPPKTMLRAVWSDGAGIAWAGTEKGAILRWDGTGWNVHASGLGAIRAIWGSSATEIWAAGDAGLYQGKGPTSDAVTFAKTTLPGVPVRLTSVWGTAANDVWAVGARADGVMPAGRAYHFTGASSEAGAPIWSLDSVSATQSKGFSRVWGTRGSGVWLSTRVPIDEYENIEEYVYRRPAGKKAFAKVEFPPYVEPEWPDGYPIRIFGAGGATDTSMLVITRTTWGRHAVYQGASTDDGATFTWSLIPFVWEDNNPQYTAMAASPAGVWAAGEYGLLREWDGKALSQARITVKRVPVTNPFYDVWTAGGEVWAVGQDIALHRAKK